MIPCRNRRFWGSRRECGLISCLTENPRKNFLTCFLVLSLTFTASACNKEDIALVLSGVAAAGAIAAVAKSESNSQSQTQNSQSPPASNLTDAGGGENIDRLAEEVRATRAAVEAANQPVSIEDNDPPVIDVPSNIRTERKEIEISGTVKDQSRITELNINGKPVPIEDNGSFRVQREVPLGPSAFQLAALDERENRAEKHVVVMRRSSDSVEVENKYGVAVIIGNRNYVPPVPEVEFAYNDAEAMKRYVVEELGFREGNIIDLRDATKGAMETVLGSVDNHKGKLFNWVKPGQSDVVVFYSGHGVPGLKDRYSYLLPVDADPNLVEINGYPIDQLYANLGKIDTKSVKVYLDACFSGDSAKGMLIQSVSGIGVDFVPRASVSHLVVLTAAQGDQVASWDEEGRYGLFTEHLLRALYGEADGEEYGNGDGEVTVAEVKRYLDDSMTYQARRLGRDQNATVLGDPDAVLTHSKN